MNNKLVLGMLLALVGIGAGCSQEPSEATTPPVEEEAKLLASLTLDNGHVVDFKQAQAGFVFMTETGKQTGQGPALSDEVTQGKTFSQIYQALAPGSATPQALLDADVQAKNAPIQAVPYAPSDVVEQGDGPEFYTAGEQTWFKQKYCPSASKCIQGWDWIDSGADQTTSWKATGMVGSEGTVTIPLKAYYWKCIDSSCVWTQFESGNIAPGYVHWVSGTGKFFYKATMSGAGKGTQVSMAINLAPMACGACNDGTCQCGHMPAADLCADHRGVDTGLGCLQQQ